MTHVSIYREYEKIRIIFSRLLVAVWMLRNGSIKINDKSVKIMLQNHLEFIPKKHKAKHRIMFVYAVPTEYNNIRHLV